MIDTTVRKGVFSVPRTILAVALGCLMPIAGARLSAQDSVVLSFGVPTPASATYHVADTLVTSLTTPGGPVDFAVAVAATLAGTFVADPDGVRFAATMESLSMTNSSPMGSETVEPEVSGGYVVIFDPRGRVDVVSAPEVSGFPGAGSAALGMAHDMFPGLPGAAVQPGDSWVDTIAWHYEDEEVEVTNTAVYTYTLVGDTVVDELSLVRIAIFGETRNKGSLSVDGESGIQTLSGPDSGFVLWDTERNRLHSMEINRDYTGTMTMSMGELPIRTSGTSRYWVDN